MMKKKSIFITIILALFVLQESYSQEVKDDSLKIERLLSNMSLEEKVSLCSGGKPALNGFRGIPRLKIPAVGCADGPRGVALNGTTAFPCGVLFGATWNPELIEKAGKVMGEEARAFRRGVLLGPGVNIQRDPLGGRFFEYYTEDPYLNASIAVGMIKGVQSEGVAACAKHFACNNRENNRTFYMSIVDDRTLNEIYFPAFKAAVQQADVATIMTSANGINYEYVSDSRKMLTDILKNKWGFKGFVMTDWCQTRSVEKAAFAGLDVSMPGGNDCGFGNALLKSVKEGKVSINDIDDKAKRILGVYDRIGILDGYDIQKGARINTKEHQTIAKEVAENGMVLLKNKKKVLPLDRNKIKNVLITGPNADKRFCLGLLGGSSGVESSYEISVLKGIKDLIGDQKVTYISSDDLGEFRVIPEQLLKPINGIRGFNGRYYVKGKNDPVLTRTDKGIDFMWKQGSPDKNIDVKDFREARYDAEIMPPVDGKYVFRFTVSGGNAIAYNDEWDGAPIAIINPKKGTGETTADIDMKRGIPYHLCVIYTKDIGDTGIKIEWETPQSSGTKEQLAKIDKAAKKADAVIYVGGSDHSLDTEERDRVSMTFPTIQENLINRLAKINKNMNVVLINGSPLEIGGWLSHVKSVLEAWYPGMEGGTAVADILFGKVNPSGKLPFTWPKKLEDVPCHKLGFQDNDYILYNDKLMVGYRYYDTKNVEPQFPFGYGLSYSNFVYSDLKVKKEGENEVSGSVKLKNAGKRDGYETVQVYVKPVDPAIDRPVHELKYFKKVFVKAGESVTVDFVLKKDAFSYYDVHKGDWTVDKCNYEIEIGKNSREIVASIPVLL